MTREIRLGSSPTERRWSFASSIGSVVTAFFATLCCVGPLVFAVLGIGGAGLLVRFERYRPFFTVLTLCLLGAAFYFNYRKPRVAPAPASDAADCSCARPGRNKAGRVVLWIATAMVIGLLSFPYLTPYLFG